MIFYERRQGFSLVQVLVVCSLVVILMTLSLPHFSWMRRYAIRLELEKMYALFFYLQHKAIVCNQHQELVFNTGANTYGTEHQQEWLPSGITFGFLPRSFGPPSDPKKLIVNPITFVGNTATFYPDGTFSAGTLYLVDNERGAMYALTSAVAPVSFIRKYRYDQGSWVQVP